MTGPSPARAPLELTHGELVALADVAGRVMAGASGDYGALREASLAALRPEFATAAAKVSAAALATVSGQ
jgi:hypothetical protein